MTRARLHGLRWMWVGALLIIVCWYCSPEAWAQASSDADKSWSSVSESQTPGTNPTRTVETHKQSGNRTVDTRSLQVLGQDGRYVPYLDVETETVQVDANTVKTIARSYVRDANGAKALSQVTEEEAHNLPGGSNVVRTTSNPDVDGKLQVVQREIEETRKAGAETEETLKTVLLPSINGGLAPAMKVEEQRRHTGNDTVETQTTTSMPDGAGNWQTGEVRNTTERTGKNASKEDSVSQPDAEGRMTQVSRTVTKETESASGEKSSTVESYSNSVPGAAPDGGLHLVERATRVEHTSQSGEQTTQRQVEQANPGDPAAGLRITVISTSTQRPGASGTQGVQTIQMRDASGNMNTVSVDLSKSTNAGTVQIPAAGAKKAAEKPSADKKDSSEQK